MDALDALDRLRGIEWTNEEGERLEVAFLPGLTEGELDGIETRLGAPLPEDYRALALRCGGIDGAGIEFDLRAFEGISFEEALPNGMAFAHDGCGNYWVADCLSTRERRSALFYACHDAPVLLCQGAGLAGFLDAMPAFDLAERESSIWKVWSDAAWNVWKHNPGLISQEDALESPDARVRAFAEEIGESCWISDLRGLSPGTGFSWGRYGAKTRVRRHGEERIFAYAPPEKGPSFVGRLLRRESGG